MIKTRLSKDIIILSGTAFFIILLDQICKYFILKVLIYGVSAPVINKFFSLTLVFNTGSAFGMLAGRRYLFLILPVITIAAILIFYNRSCNKQKLALPLGLLIGGAAGNFIDRICRGYVVDFFDFYLGNNHWPAFNFADAGICCGAALLLLQTMTKKE